MSSPTPTPTPSPSASVSESVSVSPSGKKVKKVVTVDSEGYTQIKSIDLTGELNLWQAVTAGVLEGARSMNVKKAGTMAASTALATLAQGSLMSYTQQNEKLLVEPILAGAIYAGINAFVFREKNKAAKNFLNGFIVTEASVALNSLWGENY